MTVSLIPIYPKFTVRRNFSVCQNVLYGSIINFASLQYKDYSCFFNELNMAEIPSKQLRVIVHQFTIVNSIFHFLNLTVFDIHVGKFSSLICKV